ncbi:MAG: class I SAM-dependent methyltransferase [Elusimicrobia bacterium]|nr:class I SAM-dependent methyltransferase [Elusimicrobiota bacterium]
MKTYRHCANCGFISLDLRHIVSRDRERERILLHDNTISDKGYVDMLRGFLNTYVAPLRGGIKTALDFGCGPDPVLSKLLYGMGITTDVYDRLFFPEKVYSGRKYDLITALEVMEHLEHPMDVFGLLSGLLNSTGILAATTLTYPADIGEFENWWYRRDITHISFYSGSTLEYMSAGHGMRIRFSDGKRVHIFEKK